ncbi:sugar transporter [Colletotrichum sojae]|uniref:Sugar transporter n=1 Tax=Colletotrichum sojae TaxID=2175907 RepID=A0A8H6JXY6_9PEZI|nr:sugar transporter [Colletotrichum sojae]
MSSNASGWLSKPFLTSILLGIGGFLYGYDSGIITPSLALNSFLTYFGNPDAPLRGAIPGSAALLWVSPVIDWDAGEPSLLDLRETLADFEPVIMGRLLVGYAVGTITGVAPVFGAEIAKWLRGDSSSLSGPESAKASGTTLTNGDSASHSRASQLCSSVLAFSWSALFRTPAFRKRLFVGSFVWAAAMLSGISFVQYYQTTIYATLQFSQDQQLLVSGLYGSVGPVACFLSLFFVDRVGRKKILVCSSSLLSVCYLIITILAAVYPASPGFPTNEAAQRGLIACIFAVSANYSALLGPMTWIIPPEVFTTELRAKANATVQVIHYSISLVITQCSPIALAEVGWKYYILFILTNAICAVIFALFYPETRGKSLEEIDEIFGDVKIVRGADMNLAEKAGVEEVEARRSTAE